jgi:hypothetical protein
MQIRSYGTEAVADMGRRNWHRSGSPCNHAKDEPKPAKIAWTGRKRLGSWAADMPFVLAHGAIKIELACLIRRIGASPPIPLARASHPGSGRSGDLVIAQLFIDARIMSVDSITFHLRNQQFMENHLTKLCLVNRFLH